ncbi:flagellar hook-length control protein FliK [Shewanella dokdonensis]|uniref:Flagellar hook-length control protein FliK n=1 Tax=Shewanella dokdonensis TaxID=712036 RepID=A0ABX8DDE8_9GAMM|nr:flagellar hook-length control protein FliK [Shewanella dokdonensis]MCL1073465.1 flagellar hook-length control protein FliK [Shewanella dokdonensis]QVK22743.1 flagellar hook-length control protein FliK [Shewanella dokdonensis]
MVMAMPVMLAGNSTADMSVSKNLVAGITADGDTAEQQGGSFVLPEITSPAPTNSDAPSEPMLLQALTFDEQQNNLPSSMAGSLLLLPQASSQTDESTANAAELAAQAQSVLPPSLTAVAPEQTTADAASITTDSAPVLDADKDQPTTDSAAEQPQNPLFDNRLGSAAMWPQHLAPIVTPQATTTATTVAATVAVPAVTLGSDSANTTPSAALQTPTLAPAVTASMANSTVPFTMQTMSSNGTEPNSNASVTDARAKSFAGLMQAMTSAAISSSGQARSVTDASVVSGGVNGVMPTTSMLNTGGNDVASASVLELRASTSAAVGQQLVNLLSDKVQLQYDSKIHNAQIRLDPPRLGSIDIRISVDGDRTIVHINASHATVKDAVLQTAEQLRASLAHKLGGEVLVQTGERHSQQGQQSPQPGWQEEIMVNHLQLTEDETQPVSMVSDWLNRKA